MRFRLLTPWIAMALLPACNWDGGPVLPAGEQVKLPSSMESGETTASPGETEAKEKETAKEESERKTGNPIPVFKASTDLDQAPLPLRIVTQSLTEISLYEPAEKELIVEGGKPPYTWQVLSGALPDGMALAEGKIAGTSVKSGRFSFAVQVTDAEQKTDAQDLTLDCLGNMQAELSKLQNGTLTDIPLTAEREDGVLNWNHTSSIEYTYPYDGPIFVLKVSGGRAPYEIVPSDNIHNAGIAGNPWLGAMKKKEADGVWEFYITHHQTDIDADAIHNNLELEIKDAEANSQKIRLTQLVLYGKASHPLQLTLEGGAPAYLYRPYGTDSPGFRIRKVTAPITKVFSTYVLRPKIGVSLCKTVEDQTDCEEVTEENQEILTQRFSGPPPGLKFDFDPASAAIGAGGETLVQLTGTPTEPCHRAMNCFLEVYFADSQGTKTNPMKVPFEVRGQSALKVKVDYVFPDYTDGSYMIVYLIDKDGNKVASPEEDYRWIKSEASDTEWDGDWKIFTLSFSFDMYHKIPYDEVAVIGICLYDTASGPAGEIGIYGVTTTQRILEIEDALYYPPVSPDGKPYRRKAGGDPNTNPQICTAGDAHCDRTYFKHLLHLEAKSGYDAEHNWNFSPRTGDDFGCVKIDL